MARAFWNFAELEWQTMKHVARMYRETVRRSSLAEGSAASRTLQAQRRRIR